MKKFTLMIIAVVTFLLTSAQTISPNESTEFCPNVNITFTVTLPRISNNTIPNVVSWTNGPILVSGVSNIVHTSTNTTFTFVGKFRDANINQVFRVYYSLNSNPNASYDFQFKRVKSLFYSTSCALVPNQATITVPRCQIINIPVSVSNVQWGTFGESPELCFGTISNFEYQLPNGWSIGATVSNGSNWISGGNNVTVTSDLSNGINGAIRIRPAISCGSNLENGQTPGQILISRPEPPLSISGTQNYICSGTTSFTINGMPSGASVQWSLSNTTDASISGCSTCSTVTISRNTSANTIVTLNATVTDCTGPYQPVTYKIALGSPTPQNLQFILIDPVMGKLQARVDPVTSATGYQWYKDGQLFTYPGGGTGSNIVQFNISRSCDVWYNIAVEAVNACGTSAQIQDWAYVPCDNYYAVSPNPASTDVTVSTDETKTYKGSAATINEVRIYDLQGNLKKYQKFSRVKSARINVAGLSNGMYFIEIINGTYKEKKQLLIKK